MSILSRLLPCLMVLLVTSAVSAQYGPIDDLKLKQESDGVDVKLIPAPEKAIVLFDGKSLDGWVKRNDTTAPATWKVLGNGVMQVQGGDIVTAKKFDGNFKLHVEFRVPYMPTSSGQGRGNSGVYVQGRYEVQVLDSYGLDSKDNDCGGIYSIARPITNACKAPTVWQSYDMEFQSPKCENGKKTEPGVITVYHNGVKIHDQVKLTKDFTTSGINSDPCTPGPIMLQDHGNPVQYRNMWLLPTE